MPINEHSLIRYLFFNKEDDKGNNNFGKAKKMFYDFCAYYNLKPKKTQNYILFAEKAAIKEIHEHYVLILLYDGWDNKEFSELVSSAKYSVEVYWGIGNETDFSKHAFEDELVDDFKFGKLVYPNKKQETLNVHYYFLINKKLDENQSMNFLMQDFIDLNYFHLNMKWNKNIGERIFIKEIKGTIEEADNLNEKIQALLKRDNIDEIDENIMKISDFYQEISKNHSILQENISGINVQHENLRLMKNKYPDSLIIQEFINNAEKMLRQLEMHAQYASASSRRIEKTLETGKIKVDLYRSKEKHVMQRESLSIKKASQMIEFVLVLYYSLHIWESINPHGFEMAPGWARLALVSVFSAYITIGTDLYISYYAQTKTEEKRREAHKIKRHLAWVLFIIALIGVLMFTDLFF